MDIFVQGENKCLSLYFQTVCQFIIPLNDHNHKYKL